MKDTAGNTIAAPVVVVVHDRGRAAADTTPPTVTGDDADERRDGCGDVGGADGDVLGGGAGGDGRVHAGGRVRRSVAGHRPRTTRVSNTATFTPSAALAASTTYTATISGVKDTAGNTIAAPVTWSFTTAAGPVVSVLDLERGRDAGHPARIRHRLRSSSA